MAVALSKRVGGVGTSQHAIIKFPSTAGFKGYKQFFSKESVAHPAKINLNLLRYIIETYTSRGEVILDPMAGTFSTPILASLLGRDGVGVDLEERFVKMGLVNKELTEKQASLMKKGRITVLHGDARHLSSVLQEVDSIITSPPYAEMNKRERSEEEYATWHKDDLQPINKRIGGTFSDNVNNLGNLKYGEVDSIITSPPYSESMTKKRKGYTTFPKLSRTRHMGDESSDENIGNLRHGDIDAVITSPPYENQVHPSIGGIQAREDSGEAEQLGYSKPGCLMPVGYSKESENIGNLKGETYLSAMKQVYAEMYMVLKPKGKAVLVVKNFIRNKSVVDLAGDTIRLMESVGFKLADHVLFKLPQLSFWRILYKKKYPEVDTSGIEYEHVLVFMKM